MKKLILFSLIAFVSCKKDFLETGPSNAVDRVEILGKTETIQIAFNGIVTTLFDFRVGALSGGAGHDDFGQKSFDISNDLMGNDMVVNTAGYGWYNADYQYTAFLRPTNGTKSDVAWGRLFKVIKGANDILGSIDAATGDASSKPALKGQAYALRAYAYFYLVNYFQQSYKGNEGKPGVPIYTEKEIKPTRNTVKDVYNQIIADLKEAEKLLDGVTFQDKTSLDIRVCQGLRARTALLMNDWPTAASYANKAYSGTTLMTAKQYKEGFSSITNPEWLWGSKISAGVVTYYASFFSHLDVKTGGYAALGGQKKITKALYDKIPVGDVRKTVFQQSAPLTPASGDYTSAIATYASASSTSPALNQLKFRVPTPGSWVADYVYMRTAEMYLIEAEAFARSGNDPAAKLVLEKLVTSRYPSYSAASFSGSALLDEILSQRRIELWGEGFALMDVKRSGSGLIRPTGSGNHGSPNMDPIVYKLAGSDPTYLMRIPQREIDSNPFFTENDQNP